MKGTAQVELKETTQRFGHSKAARFTENPFTALVFPFLLHLFLFFNEADLFSQTVQFNQSHVTTLAHSVPVPRGTWAASRWTYSSSHSRQWVTSSSRVLMRDIIQLEARRRWSLFSLSWLRWMFLVHLTPGEFSQTPRWYSNTIVTFLTHNEP